VDDCEKAAPALRAYVVHVKFEEFCCVQTDLFSTTSISIKISVLSD